MAFLIFYLGLAGLLTLEEAGLFLLPGDISLVGAGVYAAQGGPSIVVCWLMSALSMVLGASLLFAGVRRSRVSARVLPDRVRDLVLRHGSWGVAAARLIPGLRNATVFAAAAASMGDSAFLLGLVPAAFAWSGILLLLGYFGGDLILSTAGTIEGAPALRALSVVLFLSAAGFVVVRLRRAGEPDEPATPYPPADPA